MTGFQPSAEARIEDLRLALPKTRLQPTLYLKMIQLQLNAGDLLGKIATDVVRAHMESGDSAAFALCLDHHINLPINTE
jgi:hypothetical protein